MKYWAVGVVLGCSLLGAIAQILFKKSMQLSWIEIFKDWQIYVGFILYGFAFIFYLIALRYEDVSILYPVIALSYVWLVILAYPMLQEAFTYQKLVGSGVIILGVYLIGSSG